MKKLILLIILLMTTAAVNAISIEDLECDDGFSFVLFQEGFSSTFEQNNWTISVMDKDFSKETAVDGKWTDLNAKYKTKGGYMFQSTSYLPAGDYTINITRILYDAGLKDAKGYPVVRESEMAYYNISCPPKAFRCAKVQMNVTDCYTIGSDSYMVMEGVDENIVLDDLWFKISGTTRHWLNQTPAISSLIRNNERYLFSAFTEGSQIEWMDVGVRQCDNERYEKSSFKARCAAPRACTSDDNCKTYEFCNLEKNGFCQLLNCTDGKFHSCGEKKTETEAKPTKNEMGVNVINSTEPVKVVVEKSMWERFVDWLKNIF